MLGDKHYGASTDIWTGGKRKMYISCTLHFCDGPNLRTVDLVCAPFNEQHSGENIAKKLKAVLVEKGMDPMKCTAITTDNASNIIKAGTVLDNDKEVLMTTGSCFCHSLQLLI